MKRTAAYAWLKVPFSASRRNGTQLQPLDHFPVSCGSRKTFIPIATIIRIEGEGKYSRIFAHDGSMYIVSKSLRELGVYFTAFLRVHKSHLINPDYIVSKQIVRYQDRPYNRYIRLRNGEKVPVSKQLQA